MLAPLPSLDEIIDCSPLSVTSDTLLLEALTHYQQLKGGYSSIVVTQAEKLVGICTPQDILPRLATGDRLDKLTMAEIIRPVVSLRDTEYRDLFTVLGLMHQHQIRHLPVLDRQEQLRGMITPDTLCHGLKPSQILEFRSVSEVMTQPLQASPDAELRYLAQLMATSGQHCVVITASGENERVSFGLVTQQDIIQYRLQSPDLTIPAAEIVGSPLPSLSPTDSLQIARQQMEQSQRSSFVVSSREELLGIVTAENILHILEPMELYKAVETLLQPLEENSLTTLPTAPLEPLNELQEVNKLLRQEINLRQQAELAIAHEQKLAEAVLNVAAALVVTLDEEGRIVYFNRTCEQTTGYQIEEVQGQYLWDVLLIREAVESVRAAFRELDTGQFPEQCESVWVAKSGCRYLIAWSNTLIEDRGVKYVISTGINITERKQAEAELETRAQQQAVIAHLGQQALAQTNLEALIEEAVILTARTLDVEYSRALELLPHETELRLKAGFGWQEDIPFISAERESQVAYTLTSQTVVIDDLRRETRFVVPSVLRKHGVISGMSVVTQGKDEPFGVLEVYSTEQRAFSQDDVNFLQAIANVIATAVERQQIEEELNRFFNLSLDIFCIAQTDGYFKRVNPRFEECLGYTQEELLSCSFLDFVHLEDVQATLSELEKISLGISTPKFENRYQHKDGSYRWLSWSVIPYGENLCCAVARDVTEQKRIEDTLRNLATRISSANGEVFFQSLVLYLAKALDTEYAFVGETIASQHRIRTVAVCIDGAIAQNFDYDLAGSPCEQVIRQGMCIYPDQVQQQFFQDDWLVEIEARSYLGIPLVNSSGQTFGILSVLSRKPLFNPALSEEIIQIFAVRASSELERRQAEADLRDSEQKFRQLAENIREVFFIVSTHTRQFIYISPAFEQIWRISGEVLEHNPDRWLEVVAAEDRDRLTTALAGEHGQVSLEYRLCRSDGVRWIRMRTFPVPDSSGQIYRVVGIAEDITERKHSEALLQESEAKFRSTFEQAAVGIAHVAIDGQWLRVNQKLCDIVGYPREELLQKTYQEITHPDDLHQDLDSVEQILTGAIQTNSIEKRYLRQDGSPVWINLTVSLVRDLSGEPNYFIFVIEEIGDRKQAQEALKESERRYSSLVQAVPVGIFRTDAQGNYIYLNEQACEIGGVCEIITEQLSEASQTDWLQPVQSEEHALLAHQSWQKPQPFRCEYQFERSDGETIWLYMQTVPEINETGLVGYVGTISDISARKQAQQKLQQLNEQLELRVMQRTAELQAATSRLTTLIETLQAGVVVQDESQLVVLINQAFCDIFKIPVVPPALIGSDFSEFAQEYQHYFANPVEFAQRYQEILARQQIVSCEELQLADGRTFERDYVPIFIQDHYCGNLWMYRDITERKQAQEALQLSEARFRATFEQAAVGIIQITINGQFLRANQKFCDIVGYSQAELLNKTLLDITYPEDRERHQQQLQDLLSGQRTSISMEKRYLHQDERIIWANFTSSLVYKVTGEPDYLISVVEDISDRKRAEAEVLKTLQKEKELIELKSRFVAMTSHEFRTPLAVISSSAGLLQDYDQRLVPQKKQKHFDRIQSSVKHMTQLLNDVLTVNQAEAYKLQFEPVSIELVSFCYGLVDELQSSFSEHSLSFTTHLRQTSLGQTTLQALLDKKLLRQILSNLLSNAVKYSPKGSRVHLDLIEDEQAILKIRDQGIGIPSEDQQRLFESFHRAKNVGTIPGTGLGLMIVKKCVDLQQGKITVDSEVGVGTTVTVSLPLNSH